MEYSERIRDRQCLLEFRRRETPEEGRKARIGKDRSRVKTFEEVQTIFDIITQPRFDFWEPLLDEIPIERTLPCIEQIWPTETRVPREEAKKRRY